MFVCVYSTLENSFIEPSWVAVWDVVVGYDSSVVIRDNSFEVLPSNECLAQESASLFHCAQKILLIIIPIKLAMTFYILLYKLTQTLASS